MRFAREQTEFEAIAAENKLPQQLRKLEDLNDAQPKSMRTGKRRCVEVVACRSLGVLHVSRAVCWRMSVCMCVLCG